MVLVGTVAGCGDTAPGPTESTVIAPVIGDDETGTGMDEGSLADQVKGTFIGTLGIPGMSSPVTNYQIIVTKIDGTSVQVSGGASSTFVANLTPAVNGSTSFSRLKVPAVAPEDNGEYVVFEDLELGLQQLLAYAYHYPSVTETHNIEIFSGRKQ